ncbi:tyrosine-type recombinase/integrase [Ferribacterium limneticum]|uniref:tyrosine-type recombinase/integrase n=1 Tax=Ferribacterium limneticum TaxID=76259 RepID=UPI001CF8079D|nr:site-specific integrase [Ferribacterium limneticum]UCV22310.1 site-specific integrase [Ferribacterium limneticum]
MHRQEMCKQMQPFVVRNLRFEHDAIAERLPLLVDSRTGIPVVEPLQYTLEYLRPFMAPNTIERFCRVMQLFFLWLESNRIDLTERMLSRGILLQEHEISQLAELYRLKAEDFVAKCRAKPLAPKHSRVVSLEKARQLIRPTPSEDEEVGSDYLATRLYMTRCFLEALANKYSGNLALSDKYRFSLVASKDLVSARLDALTPPARGNPNAPIGLSSSEVALLRSIVAPNSPRAPWKSKFVRARNHLIIELLISLGLRGGELLKLKTTDINKAGAYLSVTRTPDDKEDTRQFQPQAKTAARQLPLSSDLVTELDRFIREQRANIPAKQRKHRFVFTTDDGKPLSEHSLGDIFRDLRKHCPDLPVNLTAHKLRYTHTDHLWQTLSALRGTADEKKTALRIHQGWSDKSSMPEKYGRRYLSSIADQASIKNQTQLLNDKPAPEELDDCPF